MRLPLVCLLLSLILGHLRAGESFFKKGDVIALVGGEDMAVAGEDGYLELLLTRALPDYHLRFRSLAWEGDTVFEQNRELNFPTWEEALDKVGATVVICQFGQMESIAGKEKIAEFIAAYEKLLDRLSDGGKRRVVVVSPTQFNSSMARVKNKFYARSGDKLRPLFLDFKVVSDRYDVLRAYADALHKLAESKGYQFQSVSFTSRDDDSLYRDQVHLDEVGQRDLALILGHALESGVREAPAHFGAEVNQLLSLIRAKNLLWFNYWRVQNWAFLAGDRTNQPSSRDWKDPSKRWFPAEREEFLPLVEAKEQEIDALAEKLK